MKRYLLILLTLTFLFDVHAMAWAEAAPGSETARQAAGGDNAATQEIKILIEQNLPGNFEQIQAKAMALDSEQRANIFSDSKKEPIIGFLLNFMVGLGIGSFVIGDTEGGMTELLGEAAGVIIAAIGVGFGTLFSVGSGANSPMSIILLLVGIAGVITAAVFRVGGWIRPFSYSESFNQDLQEALGIGLSTQGLSPYYQGFSDNSGQSWHEAGLAYRLSF